MPTATATVDAPGAPAPPRGRAAAVLLVLLGTLTALGPLSLDMYLPAFPQIARGLDATAAQVQLSLTACLVGLALGQLLTGPLSDRYGRRAPVVIGMLGYAAFSLLCAFAPSVYTLVGLRLGQGFAGGMAVVVARAIVRDLYAGVAAAKYFSRLTLVFGLAPILAPSLGSAVLRVSTWRGVFVTLSVIGLAVVAAVVWRLPETLPPGRRSTGGLGATGRAARVLLADRTFLGYTLAQGFAFAGMFAYIAGSSFVLQDLHGVSPTAYSVLFGVNALGLILMSQVNTRLLDRFGPRRLLIATLLSGFAAAAALLGAALLGSLVGLVVGMFAVVASVGMVMPNATALALDRHPERAGTAAAVMGGIQSVIGASAAPLAGLAGTTSATPMAVVILGSAAMALAAVLVLARHTTPATLPPSATSGTSAVPISATDRATASV